MKRRSIIRYATVFSLIGFIILVQFSTGSPLRAAEPKYGGTLTFVGEIDAMGFDAIKARSLVGPGRLLGNLVMEKLFNRGKDGGLIPVLGLSATPSSDGKVWTIVLRRGVTFHDGTPFNADAVVSHWQRLLDPQNRYRGRLLLRPIVSVEKTGDYEVRFNLKHAWLPFTSFLTSPTGFAGLIPSPKAVADGVHNRAPVGTGPFVFEEWKTGDRMVVTKNPNYWQKGKPYLDRIISRPIPDHESRYAALASGQADMMITDRPIHVKKLTGNPDFAKMPLVWRGAGILVLNNTRAPLDDVRVRRALALAWHQKDYIAASFKNIMPYTEHWYGDAFDCGDVSYPSPDLEKAKDLLAEYGKPVEIEYVHTATNRGHEAGMIVQQMFKKIGVTVNPVPSDFPGIMKKLIGKNFDMTSWLIPGFYDMSPITTAILHSQSPWNMTRYASDKMDHLLRRQVSSTDPRERSKIMCTIARKVNTDVPWLYLFGRTYYLFARNNVKNVTLPVLGEEGLVLGEVWIEP
jgi:4-phytase/acid phosphatase/peptide/nickel transport system substrate-binding protein